MHLDWWTIGLQTINFAILAWLLHRFLYRPVLGVIDARKAQVRHQLEAAQEVEDKAAAQLAAVEAERAGIAAERKEALEAAAAQSREMAAGLRAQAERDAQAQSESTRRALAAERARAFDEARRLALDLGADFARRLLAEIPMRYRSEAWIERIERHLDSLSSAERAALVRPLAEGHELTVVTASALPAETQAEWSERLRRSLAVTGGVRFQVDPELIAGADLHLPTAILRYSWQSSLAAARAELGADDRPR